jgi:predicted HicB family RNase H-like nuclease
MKDVMTYKGYIGSVHFSEDDETFYGKLEAINDLIMFEGESVRELKKAFREAVDDYIQACKETGREPQKPFKGSFNVRLAPDLHKRVALEAVKKGISLNQLVQDAIVTELSRT